MVTHRRQVFGAADTRYLFDFRGSAESRQLRAHAALSKHNRMDQLGPQLTERKPESAHSCQLCPHLKLDVLVSTPKPVIVPFTKIILSAQDGCDFFRQRLKQIFPPSSWVFGSNVRQLLDDSSIRRLDNTISLHIHTSLGDDGLCFVDCDFHLPDEVWDIEIQDNLLGWVSKGKLRLASPTTKD